MLVCPAPVDPGPGRKASTTVRQPWIDRLLEECFGIGPMRTTSVAMLAGLILLFSVMAGGVMGNAPVVISLPGVMPIGQ